MIVKAISLWEPWATLMRLGVKTFETRSWYTSYKGPFLICASAHKTSFEDCHHLIRDINFWKDLGYDYEQALFKIGWNTKQLRFHFENVFNPGKAVALVRLGHFYSTNLEWFTKELSKTEKMYGDYSPDRYAWETKMINNKFDPFLVKGAQGLFDVEIPDSLLKAA